MNKAFTLIELMAVIIILAIIASIAFPFVQDSINDSKVNTCKEQKRTIEYAAKRWGADNATNLNGNNTQISITDLKKQGYLTSNQELTNPTGHEMPSIVSITYDSENKQYEYRYNIDCSLK